MASLSEKIANAKSASQRGINKALKEHHDSVLAGGIFGPASNQARIHFGGIKHGTTTFIGGLTSGDFSNVASGAGESIVAIPPLVIAPIAEVVAGSLYNLTQRFQEVDR